MKGDDVTSAFFEPGEKTIYFSGPNCSGTPFVNMFLSGSPILQYVFTASRSGGPVFAPFYTVDLDSHPQTRTVSSRFDNPSSPCQNLSSTSVDHLIAVKEISLPFTEPLKWPLQVR